MLGYREWQVDNKGTLYSIVWPHQWPNAVMVADQTPAPTNNNGLYAFAPWSDQALLPLAFAGVPVLVIGAVDASGTVVIHDDGVIRAERMHILALRIVPPRPGHHLAVWYDGTVAYCACPGGCNNTPSTEELEEMLLRKYGVPRLPVGTGPWPTPIGTGPVLVEA